jgi:uncharacterized membrane protein
MGHLTVKKIEFPDPNKGQIINQDQQQVQEQNVIEMSRRLNRIIEQNDYRRTTNIEFYEYCRYIFSIVFCVVVILLVIKDFSK